MSNELIAKHLEEIAERWKIIGGEESVHRIPAYENAAKKIRKIQYPITQGSDIRGMPGIQTIADTVDQFIRTGNSQKNLALIPRTPSYDIEKQNDRFRNYLMQIYGIGKANANKFIKLGYTNLLQIWESGKLNELQKKGVLWRNHTVRRIPREEMNIINYLIGLKYKGLKWELLGSYRRQASSSGDVDILVQDVPLKEAIEMLGELVVDVFKVKNEFVNAMIRINNSYWAHRLDIRSSDEESWAYKKLYFTGSKEFNTKMRNRAISLGLKLNEYSLTDSEGVSYPAKTEEEIFAHLGMEYVEPKDRI